MNNSPIETHLELHPSRRKEKSTQNARCGTFDWQYKKFSTNWISSLDNAHIQFDSIPTQIENIRNVLCTQVLIQRKFTHVGEITDRRISK